MAEYIEREAAIKEFSNNGSIFVYGQQQCKAIVSRLNVIPAADVQPVRHGRWMKTGDFSDEPIDWVVCDKCKAKIPDFDYSYCPNCGAKMDGGEE